MKNPHARGDFFSFSLMNSREENLQAFGRLLTIMDELREQCPWDRKQTLQSLRHLTIDDFFLEGR